MTPVGQRETPDARGSTAGDASMARPEGPIRMCVGCRATHAQDRLLRFGLAGTRITPVLASRPQPRGRTAYLCPRRPCLDRAIKRRAFVRAFSSRATRRSVETPDPADALWAATLEQLRREIQLLDNSAENPHTHPRRRGLERLLIELSSQPVPPDRRPRTNGQGGASTHG